MSGVYHWFTRLSVRHKTLLLLAIGLLLAGLINYYLFQPQILFFEPFHPVRRSLNDHSFLQLFFNWLLFRCCVVQRADAGNRCTFRTQGIVFQE